QIVSEVLETKLENDVQGDIFQNLASAKYPRNLPFNLYLEQIRLYLGDLGTNLAEIYQIFHPNTPDSVIWAREYLGLSPEEYQLITSEKTYDWRDRYGVTDSGTHLGGLNKKDVFLKHTGLSWQDLNDLLYQNLSSGSEGEIENSVPHQFYINQILSGNLYLKLENDTIEHLNVETLIRIDCFLRLAKKLDWSFADFDWVLASISADGNKKIDAEAIKKLAKIKRLQVQTKLQLEVLCSFWHKMKTIGKGDKPDSPQDLFDRVFNNYFTIRGQETWQPGQEYDWKIKNGDERDLVIRKRLLAALQLSDGDLNDIVNGIWNEPKVNGISSNQEEVKLNLAHLSMLYRHALMLKLLGLRAQEYQLLLKFCGKSLQNLEKLEIDTLIEILELAQWMKVSGFSVYEVDYILVDKLDDILHETTEYPSVEVFLPKKKMAASIESLWNNVQLPDRNSIKIEVELDKLSETQLEEIRQELKGKLDEKDIEKLTKENLNKLSKDKLKELNDKVNEKLTEWKVEKVNKELNEKIAHHFGIEPGVFSILAPLGANFAQEKDQVKKDYIELLLSKVKTEDDDPSWQKIVKCLQYISKMLLLASKLELAEADMRNIKELYEAYDISSLTHLSIKNIQTIYKVHSQLLKIFHHSEENFLEYLKKSNASKSPSKDFLIVDQFAEYLEKNDYKQEAQQVIDKYKNPEGASVLDELAKQTDWNEEQIKETIEYLQSNKKGDGDNEKFYNSVEGLLELKQCLDLCEVLGSNIDFPRKLCNLLLNGSASQNWDSYKNLAHSVTSLVKAKYNDEEWEKVFEKLNGTLEERKCQILSEYALYKLKYENLRELSEYLLLDVEMTSCSCNSKIQLAILSVQNYLQRCRMGIEPGVTEVKIPPVWWEWIMNYRKWEANRKVFLYPENYIDPSLRKDGSPIFKELQDELLQSEITAESVEVAYRNYFDKLAELAKLQIVDGGCFFVQTPKNPEPVETLFLFAKTLTQPHTFYYRTCERPSDKNPLWGHWQKIDLQINSDYLAPVYAFNRLFIFWVETKELEKPKQKPKNQQQTQQETQNEPGQDETKKVVEAKINYSFMTASQKWVSPQALVKDVEIPHDWKVGDIKLDQEFWKQVYPIAFPEPYPKSGLITTVFGGLQSVLESKFNEERKAFIHTLNKILYDPESKLKKTIASDLLKPSGGFPLYSSDDSKLKLSSSRSSLAATTVGNFAIFAGGYEKNREPSKVVDIFKCNSQGKLEKLGTKIELTEARGELVATTVGNFAIFAGGYEKNREPSKVVDVFKCNSQGKLEKLDTKELGTEIKLTVARGELAATTVGNFAIFAGGYEKNREPSKVVDVFKCNSQGKLEKLNTEIELTVARGELAATTVGNFAIFAGGKYNHREASRVVDVFKCDNQGNLEKLGSDIAYPLYLTANRARLAATTVGNLAIFAGGYNHSYLNRVDVFRCDSKGNLKKLTPRYLKYGRYNLAATTVGNLAIFAGGVEYGTRNLVDVFRCDSKGNLEKVIFSEPIYITNRCSQLAATTVENLAIFAGGQDNEETEKIDAVNTFDFYNLSPTFSDLPENTNIPTDTTVTPIKNQSYGFILQHRSEAISALCKDKKLTDGTRLTTSTIRNFSHTLFARGLDGLLSLESQQITEESDFPPELYGDGDPKNKFSAAYGGYLWEIFFHIPFLIASTLNAHQRYNEARQWYQYIFNPTIPGKDKDRFWRFLPFQGYTPEQLIQILTDKAAIQAYKENPFDPYAIARLRIGAYEKAIVMKYIDNLLDWGDALFTQDNWESITQATTLYLLAYDLLGSKPKNVGKVPTPKPATFANIRNKYPDGIPDFLINLENSEYAELLNQFSNNDSPFNALDAYFCVSENQEFAKYWDRVEDRLFKIRHCQNIKGIERQLALFSPPIDPKQLVRQAAAGDGSMALSTTNDIPHYRFSYLLERAKGMVSTVILLGSTVLSTLEKKDAEELAVLRATQEPILLQLITKTKEKQIEEAEANLKSLQLSLTSAKGRLEHYDNLIAGGWNVGEVANIGLMSAALYPQIKSIAFRGASIGAYLLPSIFGVSNGGMKYGDAANVAATVADSNAAILNHSASIAATIAQYQRRQEDWELQKNMADWDTQQIEAQIEAAKVRIDLAKAELDVHNKSIEHSRQVEQFYKDKFTNKDLYQWMVGRLSSIYFQTYKIALDMAYSAQKAYQYELAKDDSFLQPIHWDSNKKGLLAGESLMFGLNQLEKAYLEGNDRRLEIEKIISLREHLTEDTFDEAKRAKSFTFKIEKQHFDYDFSHHYCRQIKTISVSIPAVVGPYQNINAMLSQTKNTVYTKPNSGRERTDWRSQQQIAISKGVNDNGMFVLNFQDERYLPFEGTGAISDWTLELSQNTPEDIVKSINDVIITISYTALYGG
ncbi:MAG: hypothetical protein F6K24_03235, partial [Okeania sp. SIO2D1]|nr:hypothetical protein [Okeania sp. SIO2D1]